MRKGERLARGGIDGRGLGDGETRGLEARAAKFFGVFDEGLVAVLTDVCEDVGDRFTHVVGGLGAALERGDGLGKSGLAETKNLHAVMGVLRGAGRKGSEVDDGFGEAVDKATADDG